MGYGLNKVQLIGNIGKEPEYKTLDNGNSVLSFSLATNESYFNKDTKEREQKTEWHRVQIWGKRADALSKFLTTGMPLYIEGAIRTTTSEKNGEKKYFTNINATEVMVLDKKSDSTTTTASTTTRTDFPQDNYDDSNLPF